MDLRKPIRAKNRQPSQARTPRERSSLLVSNRRALSWRRFDRDRQSKGEAVIVVERDAFTTSIEFDELETHQAKTLVRAACNQVQLSNDARNAINQALCRVNGAGIFKLRLIEYDLFSVVIRHGGGVLYSKTFAKRR